MSAPNDSRKYIQRFVPYNSENEVIDYFGLGLTVGEEYIGKVAHINQGGLDDQSENIGILKDIKQSITDNVYQLGNNDIQNNPRKCQMRN